MSQIFCPRSNAVIGVSQRPDNLARVIVENLCTFDFKAPIYAVGRQTGTVRGVPIVASLDEVPSRLDLAVILAQAFLVAELHRGLEQRGLGHLSLAGC